MAETVKIGDIANQLSTASRLVVSTDFFWVYMADGSQVKIPAEFVRAYLTDSIKPTVGSDGTWQIGGSSTGVKAEGVSPQLKAVDEGINVSYDGGTTWQTLVLYSQMDIGLDNLVATYRNIINTEQERVDAETARQSAETKRQEAETARVTAETERQSQFETSKTAADEATAKANSTYSHPPYVDSDGYYYKWNVATESYDKTDVNLTGKAFQIKKVFASVSAMEATSVDTFDENDFLLINTSDVEDEDNAKLYVVAVNSDTGKKFYSYLVDMSGFRGFTGKTPQFYIGTVTTLATGSTASASLTSDGTDTDGNPKYKLNLAIPKGDKLTLADLTDDDIAELQKPATDAIALCNTATDKANTATSNANTATERANTAAENATDKATAASKLNDTVATAEAARVTAENARVSAENARATAEASRASAETARGKAEDTRVSQESARQSNETTRQSNETSRQNAETARANAEASRATAEKARVTAETQRQSDFTASKSACDTATANAKTATTNSETQTALAKELNEHPMYVGDDNYVYRWDSTAKAYAKTTVYVKGDKGDTGATGSTGAKGDKGDNGSSPKIVNGTWWIYNDTKGEYENSGISVSSDYTLTKAKVEAVLTGDIASHTHSQYAETDDVTTELGKKADQTSLDAAVTRIASLESGSATTIETTGTGNAVTAIAKSGTKITATKGTTFLTSHQDISGKSDTTHTHSVKINGTTKTIAATGGTAVDLGTYLTSHQDISGKADKATTLAGYGITDAAAKSHTHTKSDITDLSLDFSSVTGKPTTLAGYGITDAKIESGKITLGSSSITPLTSHQSLADYLKTADADTKYLGKTAKAASASTADTATTAANASKVNNHTVESDVPSDAKFTDTEYIIPTLSAAPTESTLTFTDDDGEARSFRIGHMARVADSDSGHGYKFYQLYDLTSGKAVWGEISGEGGGDSSETVTITLTASDGSSLSGATVTIKSATSDKEVASYTLSGDSIQVQLPAGIEVTVEASRSGYATASQTFTTQAGGNRNVALELTVIKYSYITLDMTITDPASMVSGDVGGEAIKAIRADSHRYLGKLTASGVLTVCQLMDSDSTKYSDGTAATLTGSEGDVFMIMPRFYTKAEKLSTDKWKIGFAYGGDPGDGWKAWGGDDAIGVYEAYVSSSKVYSYSGKTPTVSVSQADFKTYARNRGTGFSIVKHKHQNIMAFLFYALYGNTNAQAVCGAGTSSYPKTAGQTNSLGMTDTTTSNGNSMSINFMGLENWWGDLYEWEDNVVVDARAWKVTEDDGTVRSAGTAYSSDGYTSKIMVGDYLDTIPTAASGSGTSGLCDYYYQSNSSSCVARRSYSSSNTNGGLVCACANTDSSFSSATSGSRLAFSGEIVKASSVSAYKALSAIG